MRCCDCIFKNDCKDKENDLTAFSLCNILVERLKQTKKKSIKEVEKYENK